MVEPIKSRASKGKNLAKEHKAVLAKKLKIELIRYCMIWCYNDEQTVAYCKKRGVKLSIPYYYELKANYLSDEATQGWYTEQAISVMEITHKQSIEQLNEMIKIIVMEVNQLQSTPVYITKKVKGNSEILFNPNHDSAALSKMVDTLTKLYDTRDDMLVATPVVQAIMNKHALDREKSVVTV